MWRPRSRWVGTAWPTWPRSELSPRCSARSPLAQRSHGSSRHWGPPRRDARHPARPRGRARPGLVTPPAVGRGPRSALRRAGHRRPRRATLVGAHSEKEAAESTYKRGFGSSPDVPGYRPRCRLTWSTRSGSSLRRACGPPPRRFPTRPGSIVMAWPVRVRKSPSRPTGCRPPAGPAPGSMLDQQARAVTGHHPTNGGGARNTRVVLPVRSPTAGGAQLHEAPLEPLRGAGWAGRRPRGGVRRRLARSIPGSPLRCSGW